MEQPAGSALAPASARLPPRPFRITLRRSRSPERGRQEQRGTDQRRVVQLILTGLLAAPVGVLGWRSLIAIKKNAREIVQGADGADFERLRERIEDMREVTHAVREEATERERREP